MGRKVGVGVFAVVAVLFATCGAAFANAADPRPDASGTADVINGTVVDNPDGSFTVTSGTVAVTTGGTWDWQSQTDCKQRFGVGWAVDWNGISPTAASPGAVGAIQIKQGGFFHIFETDMRPQGNFEAFTDPCANADAAGHPNGSWAAAHTYTVGQVIPKGLCVNMYDLHGSPGSPTVKDFNPLTNNDNSIRTNSFNPGAGGGFCFAPHFVHRSRLIVNIFDCSTGTPTVIERVGRVSATGPTNLGDRPDPVDDASVLPGAYTVNANAPAGYHFVDCGGVVRAPTSLLSTSDSVTVPADGTGRVRFFVAQDVLNPNLTITKSASATTVNAGDSFDYTLNVANTGAGTANAVVVTDAIPAGLTIGALTPSVGTCTKAAQNVTCNLGNMAQAATATIGIHVTTTPAACGVTTNTGVVTANNNAAVNSNPVNVTVVCPPNLTIHKSASATSITAGDSFVYTLDVANTGQGTAIHPVVTDTIPSGLTIGAMTAGCSAVGQAVTCNLADLAAGGTKSLTINVSTTPAGPCGPLTNTGHVRADNNGNVDSNPVIVTVTCPNPGLQLTKTASANTVAAGSAFDYTLVVSSVGNAAPTAVVVDDDIPVGLAITGTPTSTMGTCAVTGQHVHCAIGDLAAANAAAGTKSATITIHVTAGLTVCGVVTNKGTADAGNAPAIDSNPVDVTITCPTNVSLVKMNDADGDGTYHQAETATSPGLDVPFRVTLTNNASVPVTIDSIDDAFGTTTLTPSCIAAFVGQQLAAGASITCDFTLPGYSPAAGSSLPDTVTVKVHQTSDTTKTQTVSATAVVNTPAVDVLSVTLLKVNDADGDGTYRQSENAPTAGANVPFRVTITNNSAFPVDIESITDAFSSLEITPDCASAFVGQTLAAGASLSCDFTLPGYSPAAGSSKPDTATVVVHKTGDPTKKSTVQATAVVNTPLTPPLSLTIDKVNDANGDGTYGEDETGTSGAAVAFRVTITNNSAVAVVIDSISDVWPGAQAITPACSTQVVGITLAANGGSVTCDFTVAGYVPPAAEGARVNTLTVNVHEDGNPGNTTSQHDTSTVRGSEVQGEVITQTPPAAALPATGSNTTALFVGGLALLAMGSFLLLMSNRLSGAPLALRLPRANGSMLFTNNSSVIQRNPGYRAAPSRRAPTTSRTSGRPRGNNRRR